MILDIKQTIKMFSPHLVTKALAQIDKSTAVVVGSCWVAAMVMLVVAVVSVRSAVTLKGQVTAAAAAEPVLPIKSTAAIPAKDMRAITERLQKQFPEIKIEIDRSQKLYIHTEEGALFHEWLTSLTYLDTMASGYNWMIEEFCVGKCQQGLMKATVSGQRVSYSLPEQ